MTDSSSAFPVGNLEEIGVSVVFKCFRRVGLCGAFHVKAPRNPTLRNRCVRRVQTHPGNLQRVAKSLACHAKQPRRQSVQTRPGTPQRGTKRRTKRRASNASGGPAERHQAPPAKESSRGVTPGGSTERRQVPRLPRKAIESPSATPAMPNQRQRQKT